MSWRDRRRYKGKSPRRATPDEVMGWVEITDQRENKPPRQLDREQWWDYLRAHNPVRARRMRKDFKWAQRLLLKIGVDPEEVRWLL